MSSPSLANTSSAGAAATTFPFTPSSSSSAHQDDIRCPKCGNHFTDHEAVCAHLAVPGTACTVWAQDIVNVGDHAQDSDGV